MWLSAHLPIDTRTLRFTPTAVKLVSGEVLSGRYSADAQEAVLIRLAWAGHAGVEPTHLSWICTPILSPLITGHCCVKFPDP